ncbi:MAG: hypothetical protein R3F11_04155 [Verrucomicrobiales bacterium]
MKRFLAYLSAGAAALLTLSGCLEMDQGLQLNADGSGKMKVEMKMANPMAALGGLGDLGGGEGPNLDEMAREMAVEMLANMQGVEVWSDVSYGVGDDGKMFCRATGYFPDISKLESAEGAEEGMSGPEIAWKSSKTADGKWVLEMANPMGAEEGAEKEQGDEKPEPNEMTDEEIADAIKAKRAEFQATKAMMGMFVGGIKIRSSIQVAGSIDSVNNLKKDSDNEASMEITGAKLLEAMEKLVMDDELMKKAVLSGADPTDMDAVSPDKFSELLLGGEGPSRLVITPSEKPLFDYAAEVKKAKASQSDDLKKLLEDAKKKAEEGPASEEDLEELRKELDGLKGEIDRPSFQ